MKLDDRWAKGNLVLSGTILILKVLWIIANFGRIKILKILTKSLNNTILSQRSRNPN